MKKLNFAELVSVMLEKRERMRTLQVHMDKYGAMSEEFEMYAVQYRSIRDDLLDEFAQVYGGKLLLYLLDNYTPPPGDEQAG